MSRFRRTATAGLVAAMVAVGTPLVPFSSPIALADPGAITAVSVEPIFIQAQEFNPAVSGDGRFIGFSGMGIQIGEAGVPGAVQVALNGQGQVANGFTLLGGMSADGRHVVFGSDATNLSPTDPSQLTRVYTLDRDADSDGVFDEPGFTTIRRIPGRVATAGGYAFSDISSTGRYVAFTQPDINGASNCLRAYRYDRNTDGNLVFDEPATLPRSMSPSTPPAIRRPRPCECLLGIADTRDQLAISADGQHVAFGTDFDNLVAGDTNGNHDVIVRDVAAGRTIRVPGTALGGQANSETYLSDISSTGRYVAIVGGSSMGVYRYDRDADNDGLRDEAGATAMVVVSNGTTGGRRQA